MREYAVGAFEALSWVRSMLKENGAGCRTCKMILEEIELVMEEIKSGAAVDFRHKINPLS